MSSGKKIAIVAAVILMVVGVLLAAITLTVTQFDFGRYSTMTFETKTYELAKPFVNIDIRDTESTVHVLPADDETCRVVCHDSDRLTHTVQVEGDTLTVTRTDTRRWYEHIGFFWGEFLVTVYLPQSTYERLYIKTVSGDVRVSEELSFATAELHATSGEIACAAVTERLIAKTVSGDLTAENVSGGAVELRSTSGYVSLLNAETTALTAATTSGNITLSAVRTADLTATSTSGEVELIEARASGQTVLETVSGDIELYRADAAALRIKTTSGDVEGNLLSAKNFATRTTSGSVGVPASDLAAGVCEVTTTSGDIQLRVAEV